MPGSPHRRVIAIEAVNAEREQFHRSFINDAFNHRLLGNHSKPGSFLISTFRDGQVVDVSQDEDDVLRRSENGLSACLQSVRKNSLPWTGCVHQSKGEPYTDAPAHRP